MAIIASCLLYLKAVATPIISIFFYKSGLAKNAFFKTT